MSGWVGESGAPSVLLVLTFTLLVLLHLINKSKTEGVEEVVCEGGKNGDHLEQWSSNVVVSRAFATPNSGLEELLGSGGARIERGYSRTSL